MSVAHSHRTAVPPPPYQKAPWGRERRGDLWKTTPQRFQPRPRRSDSNHENFRGRQSCGDEIHSLTWPRRALHSCGGIVQVEEKSGKMSLERERRTHPSGSGTTQGGQAQCCARSGLAGVCRDSGECGAAEAWPRVGREKKAYSTHVSRGVSHLSTQRA